MSPVCKERLLIKHQGRRLCGWTCMCVCCCSCPLAAWVFESSVLGWSSLDRKRISSKNET